MTRTTAEPDGRDEAWRHLRDLLRGADEMQMRESVVAQQLLNEADPEDPLARTPVMLGYWWGNLAAANELVKMGADYGARDSEGRSVSWYARNFGRGANAENLGHRISTEHVRISMNKAIQNLIDPPTVRQESVDAASRRGSNPDPDASLDT